MDAPSLPRPFVHDLILIELSREVIDATWRMARRLGRDTRYLRTQLREMEAAGLVRVSRRFTTPSNNLCWELTEAGAEAANSLPKESK